MCFKSGEIWNKQIFEIDGIFWEKKKQMFDKVHFIFDNADFLWLSRL